VPFELRIERVDYYEGEAWIMGPLISGSFAGPEAVALHDTNGVEHQPLICSHGLENPADWPVVAGDGATVRLTVLWRTDALIDESRPVVGRGVVAMAPSHVDFHAELNNPLFWATELSIHLPQDLDVPDEDAAYYFFGVDTDCRNAYYTEVFEASWRAGAWPRIRARVGDGPRYVEWESAAGIEYQTRYWIGDEEEGRHVLLGYQSGHFSTPALRVEEVCHLAELWQASRYVHIPLLLATVTYDPAPPNQLTALLRRSITGLPGLDTALMDEFGAAVGRMLSIPNVEWRRDPQRGWVNNWPYSQRNPESRLSILRSADYDFIERFFADVPERITRR
jgi:hypothetical protein